MAHRQTSPGPTEGCTIPSAAPPPVQCPDCLVWTYNESNHICTRYDGPPCSECGAGTVSGFYGAPGVGRFTVCSNGHDTGDGPVILTLEQCR